MPFYIVSIFNNSRQSWREIKNHNNHDHEHHHESPHPKLRRGPMISDLISTTFQVINPQMICLTSKPTPTILEQPQRHINLLKHTVDFDNFSTIYHPINSLGEAHSDFIILISPTLLVNGVNLLRISL